MTHISTLRQQINDIDQQIIDLIAARLHVVTDIGKEKKEQGLPVEDLAREEEHLTEVQKYAQAQGINAVLVERIFRVLFEQAKERQKIKI